MLWGKMDYQLVESFVDFVKTIPHGPDAQKDTKSARDSFKNKCMRRSIVYYQSKGR